MAQLSITVPPPQFSLCSHPAIPLATETPKLPASIVGWCPKMHLSHGNLDLLLPLTHAEHSLHSVQSDVAMKTLHLPAKKETPPVVDLAMPAVPPRQAAWPRRV